MSESKSVFKGWAIVELMGHVRMAGLVEETTLAGAGVLKVDVPEATDDAGRCHPQFTQYVSPSSLYRLTPTTEEIARSVARHSRPAAVHQWELPRPALPAAADVTPCSGCGRRGLELFTDGKGGWCCADCGASDAGGQDDSDPGAAEIPSPVELLDSADSVGRCRNCGVLTSCVGERGQLQCRDCGGADPDATPEANTSDDGPYADAAFGSPPGTSVPTPAATEPEDFTTGEGLA